MLVLGNDEIETLLTIEDCIDALHTAYQALGDDQASNTPTVENMFPHPTRTDAVYCFKQMSGVAFNGVQALRINSEILEWPVQGGTRRRVKVPMADGQWVGLVYLFDPESGRPLAIFPDGVVQRLRVSATNGLAARFLAPKDAQDVALLGTGWQARGQLHALDHVVRPKRVRVYSPNREHLEAFCRELQPEVQAELVPEESAAAAVSPSTVVASATNTMTPVLDPNWIRPGRHFSTVKTQEVGPDFIQHVRPYLHTRRQVKSFVQTNGSIPEFETESGWWRNPEASTWPDLVDLIAGSSAGRTSSDDITLFVNNIGMGLQFAALGGRLLQRAQEAGAGRELPDAWFLQSVHP